MLAGFASCDEGADQERVSNPLRSHLPRYRIARHGLPLWVALGPASSTCDHGEESSERATKSAFHLIRDSRYMTYLDVALACALVTLPATPS
jgi:hypothetical protein